MSKQGSVTSTSEPAHFETARRTYPYDPSIRFQHSSAQSDYNEGATLTAEE